MRCVLVFFSWLFLLRVCPSQRLLSSEGPKLQKIPIQVNLKAPESFVQDPRTGFYFISNVNGPPSAKDANGFITRLNKDFSLKENRFLPSSAKVILNGPKGLAVWQSKLYVADIDSVRLFDLNRGSLISARSLLPAGAKFLNDLCALGDHLYVTDTGARKIFQLDLNLRSCKVFCKLAFPPNGITPSPDGKSLTVVTWGPGKILKVDRSGKYEVMFDGEPKGLKNLDGVVYDKEGNLYFSSFTGGAIYCMDRAGRIRVLISGLKTPADIGIDSQGRILVPLMQENKALVLKRETR